jgi:hypothetical protein
VKRLHSRSLSKGSGINYGGTPKIGAYALSPCDKTDIIFSYFIEKQIYNMVEVDIQLEEHGVPCVIE